MAPAAHGAAVVVGEGENAQLSNQPSNPPPSRLHP
jgi:hypothetical protein